MIEVNKTTKPKLKRVTGFVTVGSEGQQSTLQSFDVVWGTRTDVVFGKAALRKIREAGVKREFIGLRIDGPRFDSPPEDRSSIYVNDVYVGYASAAAYSPRLESNIAVGVIDIRHAIDGEAVLIEFSDLKRTARVTPLPISR